MTSIRELVLEGPPRLEVFEADREVLRALDVCGVGHHAVVRAVLHGAELEELEPFAKLVAVDEILLARGGWAVR
eukprot:CAMPEP_0174938660 /NCGR_PEP_ID=MMETSP1355-20121228/64183_1 /TAXON_ID=464990 /ORGANISM="Hemiselmis tepida, Strain CCMP443" /LENGTH=73 /DNA_ID=CAMNT_0016185607 /DNA_START=73 /DNA_END=292 /DNA_ORIENTATION=-